MIPNIRFTHPLCTLYSKCQPILPFVFILIHLEFLLHLLTLFVLIIFLFGSLNHSSRLLGEVAAALFVSRSPLDVRGVEKPDVAILILQEFCFHLQDLILVDFLHVVRHFVALFKCKVLIILLGATFK